MMPKVSVIVPIYNVGKFIERCARSLFEQTLEDMEYLFVNDCTPDKSMQILESVIKEYPDREKQIKIINHDVNRGTLVTKLDGFRSAQGEYVITCDSDDWVDKDAYKTLYDEAKKNNSDIVSCDYIREYGNKKEIWKHYPGNYTEGKDIVANSYLTGFEWQEYSNIFLNKKEIFRSFENIDNLFMWDDVYVAIVFFYHAEKVSYINKPFYHYNREAINSATRNICLKRFNNQIQIIKLLEPILRNDCNMTLNWLKLVTKVSLMDASVSKNIKWNDCFPESDKYIMKMKLWPFYWRITYYCLSHGISFPYKLILYLKKHVIR